MANINSKHPLDQLDQNEILKAVEIVRKQISLYDKLHTVSSVDLLEPEKSFILNYQIGESFERHAVRTTLFYLHLQYLLRP